MAEKVYLDVSITIHIYHLIPRTAAAVAAVAERVYIDRSITIDIDRYRVPSWPLHDIAITNLVC